MDGEMFGEVRSVMHGGGVLPEGWGDDAVMRDYVLDLADVATVRDLRLDVVIRDAQGVDSMIFNWYIATSAPAWRKMTSGDHVMIKIAGMYPARGVCVIESERMPYLVRVAHMMIARSLLQKHANAGREDWYQTLNAYAADGPAALLDGWITPYDNDESIQALRTVGHLLNGETAAFVREVIIARSGGAPLDPGAFSTLEGELLMWVWVGSRMDDDT